MSIISVTVLLALVMNPLGNLPVFLATLKPFPAERHTYIICREVFLAYLLVVIFMFFGNFLLQSLHLSEQALGIAGGIIMFIIALRMIFPSASGIAGKASKIEPLLVPLAIPLTAGPGALTTVLLLATQYPEKKATLFIAITLAASVVGIILFCGKYFSKYLGARGLLALERLSGMLITTIAVQMFLSGIDSYFRTH